MRYFLDIIGILGFYDIFIFPGLRNSLILQSHTLIFEIVKYSISSVDVGMIGRTTLKLSCIFMLIYLSFFS